MERSHALGGLAIGLLGLIVAVSIAVAVTAEGSSTAKSPARGASGEERPDSRSGRDERSRGERHRSKRPPGADESGASREPEVVAESADTSRGPGPGPSSSSSSSVPRYAGDDESDDRDDEDRSGRGRGRGRGRSGDGGSSGGDYEDD